MTSRACASSKQVVTRDKACKLGDGGRPARLVSGDFMASQQSTVDFIVEQCSGAGSVSARKMFGEYAVFCEGKLVALVCDDQLFVKPTVSGRAHIGEVHEAPPYKGARPCFFISGERWEDAEWLARLIGLSAAELPMPVKKRRTKP